MRKERIYRRLGVPELWRWRRGTLACLRLGEDGEYRPAAESGLMPGFPFAFAGELVRQQASQRDAQRAKAMRTWCRGRP